MKIETIFVALLLIGQDVNFDEQLRERLAGIKGNPFVKAAFDFAWWDLKVKRQG